MLEMFDINHLSIPEISDCLEIVESLDQILRAPVNHKLRLQLEKEWRKPMQLIETIWPPTSQEYCPTETEKETVSILAETLEWQEPGDTVTPETHADFLKIRQAFGFRAFTAVAVGAAGLKDKSYRVYAVELPPKGRNQDRMLFLEDGPHLVCLATFRYERRRG